MSRDWTREEFGITDNTPVVDIDSLERKCERLQKQLDIAVTTLKCYANPDNWKENRFTNFFPSWMFARENLNKIEELNEIHKQE